MLKTYRIIPLVFILFLFGFTLITVAPVFAQEQWNPSMGMCHNSRPCMKSNQCGYLCNVHIRESKGWVNPNDNGGTLMPNTAPPPAGAPGMPPESEAQHISPGPQEKEYSEWISSDDYKMSEKMYRTCLLKAKDRMQCLALLPSNGPHR